MDSPATHALIRFGLGRRPSEALPADPRAWLDGQLRAPDPGANTPGTTLADALAAIRDDRKMPREKPLPSRASELWHADSQAIMDQLATTGAPFRERLVWFWANHFTVSGKRVPGPLLGPYLRDAIRPHATGRFVDMLMAVMTHPAMLAYLDNVHSIGPHSPANRNGRSGLNENLARECLELHTVGVGAGYSQADVTALAAVLTGWTYDPDGSEGGFSFHPDAHEPGPKTVMGQIYPPGMAGGVAVLTWLADHPATHRRLAVALVQHFVADDPPPDAVRCVEGVLRDTRGDLGAAAAALVGLDAAWCPPLGKLRAPRDFVVASVRALELPAEKRPEMIHWIEGLGQGIFSAPLPNGWGDTAASWDSGENLLRRADLAWALAGRAADRDPAEVMQDCLGPLASASTSDAVRRAGSRREGMTLLMAGPEFQRR